MQVVLEIDAESAAGVIRRVGEALRSRPGNHAVRIVERVGGTVLDLGPSYNCDALDPFLLGRLAALGLDVISRDP